MRRGCRLAALLTVLAASRAGGTVSVKKNADFKEIKRTAIFLIPDAQGLDHSGEMVTDMIAVHLSEAGLSLLDRTTQQMYLRRRGIEVTVHTPREKIQAIGKALGVQAVVLGRITAVVEKREVGTMAARRKIIVKRNGKFVQIYKDPERGPGNVRSFHIDGRVDFHLLAKMIHVETGEILWFISAEKSKYGFQKAVRAALNPGMRKIKRVIRRSLKGYTFKPKKRKHWKGLRPGWDKRHEKGRF